MKRCRVALRVVLGTAVLLVLLSANALAATKPAVSLKAAASSVTAGKALLLSGTVSHARASAKSVVILKQVGKQWQRLATVKLSAKHRFAVKVTPAKTGTWRLVAQYRAGTVTARSRVIAITVKAAASAWAAISVGGGQTLALKKDGTLWAWGGNMWGELGLGDTGNRLTPTEVGSGSDWAAVSCGMDYTLALKKDGTLWASGLNDVGQLGLGDTGNRLTPTEVGSGSDWAAVACGDDETVALRANGTLWSWGDNDAGQLGVGSFDYDAHPTPTGVGSGWAAVAAGPDFIVAIKADGTLWAWGFNYYGQLGLGVDEDGLGDTDNRYTPTQVGSGSGWVAVSCGDHYTLALKSDGTLWASGDNFYGQLGLGSSDYTRHCTPTAVGGGSDWAAVSCGGDQALALKNDGTLWTWGSNAYGQLGLGDTTERNTPTEVGNGSDWAAVSCGGGVYALALKKDGTLWAWGENGAGQLGLGDTTNRLTPTEVGSGSP